MWDLELARVTVAPGVSLAVRRRPGGRRPYVLVHGLSSNARTWDGVADRLAAAGHEVLSVDLRGHGQSDAPEHGYDTSTAAADIASLINELGLINDRSPILAGQSWGASVVILLAARYPGLPRALCCVDGGWTRLAERFPTWTECEATLAPPTFAGLSRDYLRGQLRAGHPDWPAAGVEATLDNFETLPDGTVRPHLRRDRHLRILHSMWETDPLLLYPHIDVPVLLMPAYGEPGLDHDAKHAAVTTAADALHHAAVVAFQDADHHIHIQHPGAVAELLRSLA